LLQVQEAWKGGNHNIFASRSKRLQDKRHLHFKKRNVTDVNMLLWSRCMMGHILNRRRSWGKSPKFRQVGRDHYFLKKITTIKGWMTVLRGWMRKKGGEVCGLLSLGSANKCSAFEELLVSDVQSATNYWSRSESVFPPYFIKNNMGH
jgi:hypothetical protein